ncbi:MAG: flagellar motor switch protein FliN [Planctomycetaceae bacterium]|nr:flagellar motor switch protein FliN [Planctomycetaceae bacterium]
MTEPQNSATIENRDAPSDGQSTAYGVTFPPASPQAVAGPRLPLKRFYDVNVNVSVELGQVTMSVGELLQLGEGAVIELDRAVSDSVDVIAQGVRLARGEVVVVEDRYAVRITELESTDDNESTGTP